MKKVKFILLTILIILSQASIAKLYRPDEMTFVKNVPDHPEGASYALLEGNPNSKGLFSMRIRFPANYVMKPHRYQATEQSVVIAGTMFAGFGNKIIKDKQHEYPAGSFFVFPAGELHWGVTGPKGATVQFYMIGPMKVHYHG